MRYGFGSFFNIGFFLNYITFSENHASSAESAQFVLSRSQIEYGILHPPKGKLNLNIESIRINEKLKPSNMDFCTISIMQNSAIAERSSFRNVLCILKSLGEAMKMECYIHIQSFWVFKVGQNVSGEALQTESFGYFKKLRKFDKVIYVVNLL